MEQSESPSHKLLKSLIPALVFMRLKATTPEDIDSANFHIKSILKDYLDLALRLDIIEKETIVKEVFTQLNLLLSEEN